MTIMWIVRCVNPNKVLWNNLDKMVKVKKPTNFREFYRVKEEGWRNILQDRCIDVFYYLYVRKCR